MGICDSKEKNQNPDISTEPPDKIKEKPNIIPISRNEIKELFSYESALCKIRVEEEKLIGTGFFCEINDNNIPFKKALFTNNHVLNESYIKSNKIIELEYLKEKKKIEITKNRKKFTSKVYDYTCIEIFDTDKIKKFFEIDKSIFENENSIKNKEIFVLQYPNGGELSYYNGVIADVENGLIEHTANTLKGSSGSPLIERYNNKFILGIHFDYKKKLAIPFDLIIKDLKNKLSHHIQILKLIYDNGDNSLFIPNSTKIFGKTFVENNKDNIQLVIDNKKLPLVEKYELKEGKNTIQMIILNKLTNLEYMFFRCKSLVNIDLSNIDALKNWNVSNGINFRNMFAFCKHISNIDALKNWNVSNGKHFAGMLGRCESLSNIDALKNWNVSNGINFVAMFGFCKNISNIDALKNWNVSKGKHFSMMFFECESLSSLKILEKWNVSNGNDFNGMFGKCSSLTNLTGLEKWNIQNGYQFELMFYKCSSLLYINPLKNWNVSKGRNFSAMFYRCSSLLNLKGLENWDVSNGIDFSQMFRRCSYLTNLNPLKNWNVSKGRKFTSIFIGCTSLKDLKILENWKSSKEGDDESFKSVLSICSSPSKLEDPKQLSSEKSDESFSNSIDDEEFL